MQTNTPRKRTAGQLAATAYHEAGHAVAAWLFGFQIKSASIIPDGDTLGCVVSNYRLPKLDEGGDVPERAIGRMHNRCIVLMAGAEAQRRFRTTSYYGDSSDFEHVCNYLHLLYGPHVVQAAVKFLSARTRQLFEGEQNWRLVEYVAEALLREKHLSGRQIKAAIIASYDKQFKRKMKTK